MPLKSLMHSLSTQHNKTAMQLLNCLEYIRENVRIRLVEPCWTSLKYSASYGGCGEYYPWICRLLPFRSIPFFHTYFLNNLVLCGFLNIFISLINYLFRVFLKENWSDLIFFFFTKTKENESLLWSNCTLQAKYKKICSATFLYATTE